MANDELDTEPEVPDPEEEDARKRAELLSLAASPFMKPPPPAPLPEPPARPVTPEPPPAPVPQTFLQRLMAAPNLKPSVPPPPPQPKVSDAEVKKIEEEVKKEPDTTDTLLPGSKAAILASEMQGTPQTDNVREAKVRQAGEIKKYRGFSPEVDAAIVKAANAVGIDPDALRAIAAIESGGDPRSNINKGTQYKGLFQIGRDEWRRTGDGSIYSPDDNAMSMARLIKLNRDAFVKHFGREPTPQEIYMMHQQGLGFYTRGAMTNISGNLPAGAKADPANWTHGGFEQFWTNVLNKRMDEAKGAQVAGVVPTKDLGQFLNPEPSATQAVPLTGGLSETPTAAAQTAALFNPTPLEQIKGITDTINKAAVKGAVRGERGIAPRGVKLVPRQTQVEGDLSSVSHTSPTLPIPGMPTPGPTFAQQQLLNPTVLSTAASFMAQNQPPPPPAPQPGVMDKVKAVLDNAARDAALKERPLSDFGSTLVDPEAWQELGRYFSSLGSQTKQAIEDKYHIPDLADPQSWNTDTAMKLWEMNKDMRHGLVDLAGNTIRGSAAGIIQKANIPVVATAGLLAATSKLLGSTDLRDAAVAGMTQVVPWIDRLSKTVAGITPDKEGVGSEVGQFVGRNITGGPLGTALSMGTELAGPTIMDALKTYGPEIPNINPIGTASATDLTNQNKQFMIRPSGDGKHVIAETAAGPTTMDDATVNALGLSAIATLGIVALPALTRSFYRNVIGPIDPARELAGLPGTQGMVRSSVFDYWKANTLSVTSPLVDIYERHFRALQRDGALGLNPKTGAEVADALHIYSNSGIRNYVSSIMEHGQMKTTTMEFDAPMSVRDLHDFAGQTPAFRDYLRLKISEDRLAHNNAKLDEIMSNPRVSAETIRKAPEQYPFEIADRHGIVHDLQSVQRSIGDIEAAHPNVVKAYRGYQSLLDEGRRFVSDGAYAPEDWNKLQNHVVDFPSTPIFNANKAPGGIWQEIWKGQDPLHVLERELGDASANRIKLEGVQTYVKGLPENIPGTITSAAPFRKVDENFLRGNTVENDSILKLKQQGVTHTYVGDPMVVGLLTLEPAGFVGTMDNFFKMSKQGFQLTTTGPLASFFATTSAYRTWKQHFVTAPAWSQRVGPLGYLGETMRAFKEVPRQLTPELAAAWKPAIDSISDWVKGTRLGDAIGENNVDVVSRILTAETANSFRWNFERAGGKSQSWIAQSADRRSYINRARNISLHPGFQGMLDYLHSVAEPWDRLWKNDPVMSRAQEAAKIYQETKEAGQRAWKANTQTFRGVADSPNQAWALKNRNTIDPVTGQPITMEKLVAETRRLTGDPSERGAGRFRPPGTSFEGKPLPFQVDNTAQQFAINRMRGWIPGVGGRATDLYHAAIPWSGVTSQSLASTIAAMATNPYKSAMWLGLTQVMPSVAVYSWNRWLGPDYINYQMEGRSENTRNNYTYVGIPGKKPWEGVELPDFQEGLPIRRSATLFVDQLFGRSPYTFAEEYEDLWKSVLKTVIVPPLPSPVGMVMGGLGATAPEGFSGRAIVPHGRGFRQYNKEDNLIERTMRAATPAIVDYWTQYYAAAHAEEGTRFDQLEKGLKAMGKRIIERAPLTRDVLGYKPPVSGSTRITDDLYARKETIDDLQRYYTKEFLNRGMVNTKLRSRGGKKLVEQFVPEGMDLPGDKTTAPGIAQPLPTNPLFEMTAKTMEQLFKKDSPQKGGRGYQSMWGLYGQYSRYLDSLRNVAEGHEGPWLAEFNKNPMRVEKLRAEGIDTTNIRQVKDYYTNKRNLVAKEIFYYMRAAEQHIDALPQIRQALGPDQHFTIEMANPYGTPKLKLPNQ